MKPLSNDAKYVEAQLDLVFFKRFLNLKTVTVLH